MLGTMTSSANLSRTTLRVGSAIGAGLSLVGVVLIVVTASIWQPLSAAPVWMVTLSGVVVITGIVCTVIFSTSLARREHR